MTEIDGKYGIITSSKKQFHSEEPIFLLRGQDPLAPKAVLDYAQICQEAECHPLHIEAVFRHAERIEKWQREHPELVKERPGPSEVELEEK